VEGDEWEECDQDDECDQEDEKCEKYHNECEVEI
jgi:hypothetical protein